MSSLDGVEISAGYIPGFAKRSGHFVAHSIRHETSPRTFNRRWSEKVICIVVLGVSGLPGAFK
jgi:hypothetical protein